MQLIVEHLGKNFNAPGGMFARRGEPVVALADVSFALARHGRLGVVGESGCGKTTLGRLVCGLYAPDAGRVLFEETDVHTARGEQAKRLRAAIQMIWQDNAGALDPRLTVGRSVREPLLVHGWTRTAAEADEKAARQLERVGLDRSLFDRKPHELSGGQRQRVGIARALIMQPALIVADEPVASLDVSVQTQILDLLGDLVAEGELSLLFISHDIRVVRAMTDRCLVLYRGRMVELGPTAAVTREPSHPYTVALMKAVPALHPDQRKLGTHAAPMESAAPSAGCPYAPRCDRLKEICRREKPPLVEVAPGHSVACFHQE